MVPQIPHGYGIQQADDADAEEELSGWCPALSPGGPFATVRLGERDYVLLIEPYAR